MSDASVLLLCKTVRLPDRNVSPSDDLIGAADSGPNETDSGDSAGNGHSCRPPDRHGIFASSGDDARFCGYWGATHTKIGA